jgi:hypothetical protein
MRTMFPFKSSADSPQIPVGEGSIRAICTSFKQKGTLRIKKIRRCKAEFEYK